MIKGTYVISSNGEKILEVDNMITANGLLAINRYLSGQAKYWAESIAVGALSSSATASTTQSLQYEIFRYPVTLKSYVSLSTSTNQQILKATIDPLAEFQAYELGVFPARIDTNTFYDHHQITDFSETASGNSAWRVNGSAASMVSTNSRVGASNIALGLSTTASVSTASITNLLVPSSFYSEKDYLGLLYYVSSSISAASVTVTFGDNSTPQLYWSGSSILSATPSGGFYETDIDMGVKPDAFLDPITTASINFNGSSGSVVLDHMKFYLGDALTTDLQLISRTTSSASNTPLFTKYSTQPMDIEYYIQVT